MTTLTVRGTVFSDETGPFTIPNYRYTFQNNGPLTTTYIPPPRCTDPSRLTLAYRAGFREEEEHLPPRGFYNVDCAMTEYLDCMPTSTTTPMTMAEEQSVPIGVYYSPGIHCPSGWETIAQAARDGDNVPTTSGAMSLNAPESMSFPYHYYTAALMASSLKPSETIAVCCPSGYTADRFGGCWDTVTSFTPTAGCQVYASMHTTWDLSTETYTAWEAERTKLHAVNVRSSLTTITYTETWDSDLATLLTPFASVTAVTMIHHESDIKMDAKAATQTGDIEKAVKSTPNTASRLQSRRTLWDGLEMSLGASVIAIVLGAAIILPL